MRRIFAAFLVAVAACGGSEGDSPAKRLAEHCRSFLPCIDEHWDPNDPQSTMDDCGGRDDPVYEFALAYAEDVSGEAFMDVAVAVCDPGVEMAGCAEVQECISKCYASSPADMPVAWNSCAGSCTSGSAMDALARTAAAECHSGGLCDEFKSACR